MNKETNLLNPIATLIVVVSIIVIIVVTISYFLR